MISLPDWLRRALQVRPVPRSYSAMARAAAAVTAPLAVGFATGHVAFGALTSVGSICAVVIEDRSSYRMRLRSLAAPLLVGTLGLAAGIGMYGQGWWTVAGLTTIALISGMVSSVGFVSSSAGMMGLLLAILGAGLPIPGPIWLAPLLFLIGGGLELALAVLGWRANNRQSERRAVVAAYRATADLLDTATTSTWTTQRQTIAATINQAYDLVAWHRFSHPHSGELPRLLDLLNALHPVWEATPAIHRSARPAPTQASAAIRLVADEIESTGGIPSHVPTLPQIPAATPAERALSVAMAHVNEVATRATIGVDIRSPRKSWRNAANTILTDQRTWHYGLRLGLCVFLAQSLTLFVAFPHAYWIPLTVGFIIKPDRGSIFTRSLLRVLGTLLGVVVAAAILWLVPRNAWQLPVFLVIGALLADFTPRSYGLQTAAMTPAVLLVSDVLDHQGLSLTVPRLLDTLVAAAIVLVAGYLLWPSTWRTSIGNHLSQAAYAAADYFDSITDTPAHQFRARRRFYQVLSQVRLNMAFALTEPPPASTAARDWLPVLDELEHFVEAHTTLLSELRGAGDGVEGGEIPSGHALMLDKVRILAHTAPQTNAGINLRLLRMAGT